MPNSAGIPVRFAATKLAEGDSGILEALKLSQNEQEMLEHIICQMEEERGLDRAAAIADMRFSFYRKHLTEACVVKPHEKQGTASAVVKIDQILTGKYTSYSIFYRYYGDWFSG